MTDRKLKLVVHGEWGSGKSWLADTAPGPRLILDAEGGVNWTPSKKVLWNDNRNPNDLKLGPDDSAVVHITDMEVLYKVDQWLIQSDHPFKSIVIDSLTEMQMRLKDRIKPAGQRMMQNDWGELGDRTIALIRRSFLDYTMGVHPVDVVVIVCGTQEVGADHPVMRPMLQGSSREKILQYADVGAYLGNVQDEEGNLGRRALFAQRDGYAAKDRTNKLGITMDGPTIPAMLDLMYGPDKEATK